MTTLLALDLSLRGLGMIAMPSTWGGDWDEIGRKTFEHPLKMDAGPREQVNRLLQLASEVVRFARTFSILGDQAIVEDYAYSKGQSRAHLLAELGGVVKSQLFISLGVVVEPVNMSTARKFLLGRLPKKTELLPGGRKKDSGAKAWAQYAAKLSGCPEAWTEHERDAWVVANVRAGELGWHAITGVLSAQDFPLVPRAKPARTKRG